MSKRVNFHSPKKSETHSKREIFPKKRILFLNENFPTLTGHVLSVECSLHSTLKRVIGLVNSSHRSWNISEELDDFSLQNSTYHVNIHSFKNIEHCFFTRWELHDVVCNDTKFSLSLSRVDEFGFVEGMSSDWSKTDARSVWSTYNCTCSTEMVIKAEDQDDK